MKPTITVNIGLNRNNGGKVSPSEAFTALAFLIGKPIQTALKQSETEETLVALVEVESIASDNLPACIAVLSHKLNQDCIAWKDSGGNGHLSGPEAESWAPFNPAFFLELGSTETVDDTDSTTPLTSAYFSECARLLNGETFTFKGLENGFALFETKRRFLRHLNASWCKELCLGGHACKDELVKGWEAIQANG